MTSSCPECCARYKVGKTLELFDNFGDILECFNRMKSYNDFSRLAIVVVFCNIFWSSGFSYLHLDRHMTWKDNQRILDGSIGVIKCDLGGDLKTSTDYVNKAMTWLLQNNLLYLKFIPPR